MNIRLENADCMKIMAEYPDKWFDLVLADPLYGLDRNGMNMGNSVFNKDNKEWDKNTPDKVFFEELFRISKNQIIWGGNYFQLPPSQYFAIWDKGETMYGRDFAECEFAWIRGGGTRIYKKSPNQPDRIHPTQKPIKLYEWILKNYSDPTHKIFDPMLGSGSSLIACDNFGIAEFVGCELDADYFNAMKKRYDNYKLQTTLQL